MRILAYKGISPISKAIRWQTRSEFSHIAVELDDSSIIEAWHKGGVQHVDSFRTLHTAGTQVVAYKLGFDLTEEERTDLESWLKKQVGKKYDFMSVARFVTRRKVPANDKWFCSELAEQGFVYINRRLLNGNPSEHSPRDTVMSPLLISDEVLVC